MSLQNILPEQTRRMNCSLDYWTDFYSLGMTFYEMLAGELPFHETDAVAWIHAHIAKKVQSLADKNSEIPQVLSDIIDKLISKNVDDRYCSTFGLKHNLKYVLSS